MIYIYIYIYIYINIHRLIFVCKYFYMCLCADLYSKNRGQVTSRAVELDMIFNTELIASCSLAMGFSRVIFGWHLDGHRMPPKKSKKHGRHIWSIGPYMRIIMYYISTYLHSHRYIHWIVSRGSPVD